MSLSAMVRMRPAAIVLCLTVSACSTQSQGPCHAMQVALLPLDLTSGHAVTRVDINGVPFRFMVDTGADVTLLTKSAAKRLDVTLQPLGLRIGGIGGYRDTSLFVAHSFVIGEMSAKHFRVTVADTAVGTEEEPLDGILGADFLSHYDLDLDFGAHQLGLYALDGTCDGPASILKPPVYEAPLLNVGDYTAHREIVKAVIGGVTVNALIDSGTDETMLELDVAKRLGLDLNSLQDDPAGFVSGFGPKEVPAAQHKIGAISVGEVTINHLPVAIINTQVSRNEDMALGMDFLLRVHAWVSYSSNTLLMNLPEKQKAPK